jgi:PKD repeat protein
MWRRPKLGALCVLVTIAPAMLSGCFVWSTGPEVHFTLTPSAGASPLEVRFDATASFAAGGAIVRYDWNFGDGSTGTGVSVLHTYASDLERAYTVTLTLTDDKGRPATATATVTVHPPVEPPPQTAVEFVWPFHFDAVGDDAANLNDEYFTVQNNSEGPVDLTGWTVENERGVAFRFPAGFVLEPDATVYIHSGAGTDTAAILYWNASEPVWNNTTDIAVLRDAAGDIVDVYGYASC